MSFKPFDEPVSLTIGGLTCEGDQDKLIIFGDLEICKDKASLDQARALLSILSDAIGVLEASDIPDVVPPPPPSITTKNPFS